MPIYDLHTTPELEDPVLLMALSGWVDAGEVGTQAVSHLGEGSLVAEFDPDVLYDFRSHRPVLTIKDGRLEEMDWPGLTLRHLRSGERDLLTLTGDEPDARWGELTEAVGHLAGSLGVQEVVSLGAVPAAIPHTFPTPLLATSSDPDRLGEEDRVLEGRLQVPGAAVNALELHLRRGGIPATGFWAQVPHYVTGTYWPGVLALVSRLGHHVGVEVSTAHLQERAESQIVELDEIVAERPDAKAYVERLESLVAGGDLPSAEEIGAEVERFLRETTPGEDPFGEDDD